MKTTMSEGDIQRKFTEILKKADSLGIPRRELGKLSSVKELRRRNCVLVTLDKSVNFLGTHVIAVSAIVALFLALFIGISAADWPVSKRTLADLYFRWYNINTEEEPCLLVSNFEIVDHLRPPVDCRMCMGIEDVDRVQKINPFEFESKYAYSGRPVIIEDGTEAWTAIKTFNYDFFKEIYGPDSVTLLGGLGMDTNCQFFPYKTSFKSLGEVFNMSAEQAKMLDGTKPWYVGWSNCDPEATKILREHYQRPYFLPENAESSKTDWIFMGSPGYGANLHIDNVHNPSWQAQITGAKKWVLEPPPECYLVCKSRIEVIVKPGQIIVVDTNRWFHATEVVSEDMSITIGSEYD